MSIGNALELSTSKAIYSEPGLNATVAAAAAVAATSTGRAGVLQTASVSLRTVPATRPAAPKSQTSVPGLCEMPAAP